MEFIYKDFFTVIFRIIDKDKTGDRVGDKVGDKVGNKVGDTLSTNQHKILDHIKQKPTISARELAVLVEMSSRKIEENLAKLKQKGYIQRIGSTRGRTQCAS